MVRIQVGTFDYELQNLREDDLIKQIKGHRNDGVPLYVRITIKSDHVDMILSTPDCQIGGGGRTPNDKEKELFDLWNRMRLNSNDFAPGQLIAFLKQIQSLC